MRRIAVLTVCVPVLTLASLASAQPTSRVKLRTMSLEVELPAGWGFDPDPGEWSIGDDVLSPGGAMWPTVEVMRGFGTCEKILEHWRHNKPLEPRLSIIPEAYHPMVVYDEKNPTAVNYVHTCLGTAPEPLHVRLRFVPTENNAGVTAVLAAIARAYENRPGKRSIDTQPPSLPAREQRLPASGLVVKVPGNWRTYQERVRNEPVDLLTGGGESIIIARFDKNSCAFLIKAYEDQNKTPASPLPDFAPRSFYGSAVVQNTSNGLRYTFCRSLGSKDSYMIMATVAMADRVSPDLVDTLHSIAKAIDDIAPAPSTTPTVATLASRTYLSGSGLTVLLPTGWSSERAKEHSVSGDSIIGPNEVVLVVRIERSVGCRVYLDRYARSSSGTQRPLPAFAPTPAFPETVVTHQRSSDVYGMCIDKSPSLYALEVHLPPGATGSSELASVLKSIGEAIRPPAAATSSSLSGSTSAGSIGSQLDVIQPYSRKINQLAFEVRGAMLSPSNDSMSGSYGVAVGLSRLNLGRPGDAMTMATELVAVGGYATNAGITVDVRTGLGAALSAGSSSRIGVLVGAGFDGIGIGEDEDPSKLVQPFDSFYYATAVLRTWFGRDKGLQLSGSYRSRGDIAEYLGEARVFVVKKRSLSVHAFYQDVELARVIGGGLALGL